MNDGNVLKKTINLSGKQRMLTQRMSKLAVQIQFNIQKKESSTKLAKMALLYADTLKALKEGDTKLGTTKATNKEVVEQLAVVEKAWKAFYVHIQTIIADKDDGKSFNYVMVNNENLLKISNELVKRYEASNTSSNYLERARLRVVNIAGRQRMLTQKMTKEKLLSVKGDGDAGKKLLQTIQLFDDSLSVLNKGDTDQKIPKASNEKIIEQLKIVSLLWDELKPLYEKKKNSAKELALIISKNPMLLKEMNSMVLLAETEVEY